MIFLSSPASGSARPTLAYSQRGLTDITICRLSEIAVFGIARFVQAAYAGYRAAIDAFCCATQSKYTRSTNMTIFPIMAFHDFTIPIPFPRIICQLAKKPTDTFLKTFLEGLSRVNGRKIDAGKGNPVFVLDQPDYATYQKIKPLMNSSSPQREGYAQMIAIEWAGVFISFIQSFLATNTYEFKLVPESDETKGFGKSHRLGITGSFRRAGLTLEASKKMKLKDGGDAYANGGTKTDDEPNDLTPNQGEYVLLTSSVLVAKPSPHPASNNYGPPSKVPNKGGLLFPYFEGMIAGDPRFLRQMASLYLVRCLSTKNLEESKDNFKLLRDDIASFAYTASGLIVQHIMMGIHLALQTQTILFLIFEEGYRGFTLLGQEFEVFFHGRWMKPLSASDLRKEVESIQTKKMDLGLLASLLAGCKDINGDNIIPDVERLSSRPYLGSLLAVIDTEKHEDTCKEITTILSRILPGADYFTFKPENITWALDSLHKLPEDISGWPMYIPQTGWGHCGDDTYRVMACFGPRSFSFRNSKGTEIVIPVAASDKDPYDVKSENPLKKFIIYEKPILQCVQDMRDFRNKGSMRMDLAERAGPVRGQTYDIESRRKIWAHMKMTCAMPGFLTKGEKSAEKKRTHETAFGTGDQTSFSW
jgi:hypothetical protein